jgi:molecular chaperone DnaK (HSP70)
MSFFSLLLLDPLIKRVQIYEGERKLVAKNNLLGEFSITGLSPGMAGTAKGQLTLKIDGNGILKASANHNVLFIFSAILIPFKC